MYRISIQHDANSGSYLPASELATTDGIKKVTGHVSPKPVPSLLLLFLKKSRSDLEKAVATAVSVAPTLPWSPEEGAFAVHRLKASITSQTPPSPIIGRRKRKGRGGEGRGIENEHGWSWREQP